MCTLRSAIFYVYANLYICTTAASHPDCFACSQYNFRADGSALPHRRWQQAVLQTPTWMLEGVLPATEASPSCEQRLASTRMSMTPSGRR